MTMMAGRPSQAIPDTTHHQQWNDIQQCFECGRHKLECMQRPVVYYHCRHRSSRSCWRRRWSIECGWSEKGAQNCAHKKSYVLYDYYSLTAAHSRSSYPAISVVVPSVWYGMFGSELWWIETVGPRGELLLSTGFHTCGKASHIHT